MIETRTLDKPGRLYDANEQCQLAYGQAAKFCGGQKFMDVSVYFQKKLRQVLESRYQSYSVNDMSIKTLDRTYFV